MADEEEPIKRPQRTRIRKNPPTSKQKHAIEKRRWHALKELKVHKPKGRRYATDLKKFEQLKAALRETYAQVVDKFDGWKYFSERHFRFAQQYARNGRSNPELAMRMAGYDYGAPNNIAFLAKQALKLPGMEELIAAFELEEKAKMKLNVEDVVDWFRRIATAAMETGDFTNANRAMENLGKYLGMFVEKKEITHKVIHNKAELDARIAELTGILKEAEPDIEAKLRIH